VLLSHVCYRPLQTVNNPGFRNMVSTLNPAYGAQMPKVDAFKLRAMKTWKAAVPLLCAMFLLGCTWMALSEDGWSAPGGGGSFSGLVGHWIDSDWVLHTTLLACRQMTGTTWLHYFPHNHRLCCSPLHPHTFQHMSYTSSTDASETISLLQVHTLDWQ
jgi:hypothetical protein